METSTAEMQRRGDVEGIRSTTVGGLFALAVFIAYMVASIAQRPLVIIEDATESASLAVLDRAEEILESALVMQTQAVEAASVGPGFLDSFNVTCAATATQIESSFPGTRSIGCQADGSASAAIFIGDSGVTSTAYMKSLAAGESFASDVRRAYCIVASGTQTLHCGALVPTATAP